MKIVELNRRNKIMVISGDFWSIFIADRKIRSQTGYMSHEELREAYKKYFAFIYRRRLDTQMK